MSRIADAPSAIRKGASAVGGEQLPELYVVAIDAVQNTCIRYCKEEAAQLVSAVLAKLG